MDKLILWYNVCPVNRVQLTVELRKDTGHSELWSTYPHICDYDKLIDLSVKMQHTLQEAIIIGSGPEKADATGHLESLRSLGTDLRKALLPDDVVERLKLGSFVHNVIFECDPLLNGVPYGHMFIWSDFLCFSFAVGKQLLSKREPQVVFFKSEDVYKSYSIFDPDRQLSTEMKPEDYEKFVGNWDRFREICNAIPSLKIRFDERAFRPVTKKQAEEAIRYNQFVNFVCHHIFDEENPDASGYVLENGKTSKPKVVFTAADMLECLGAGDQRPRLILSVSCESGITRGWEDDWPENKRLHGMVDAVLRKGIPHYISTVAEIPAVSSSSILTSFYKVITSGQTVGESLRQAMLAFRSDRSDPLDIGTIMGLAFVLYGDPSIAYFCNEGHHTDNMPTVTCSSIDESGSICGLVVCQKEEGFGQRRCNKHWKGQLLRCSAGHKVPDSASLQVCSADGCVNTLCQECTGSAMGLCWFHACNNGHKIKIDAGRKICQDPRRVHPEEKRTVCPLDNGWLRGACDECLAASEEITKIQEVCPHCGRFVTQVNPWYGMCSHCGMQTCAAQDCGPWQEATLYCRKPRQSKEEKDKSWLDHLERIRQRDCHVASCSYLTDILEIVEQFQANVLTNVKEQTKRFGLMPRLSLPVREIIGPQGRILDVKEGKADLGGQLFSALQSQWNTKLPIAPDTGDRWQPPAVWLKKLREVNQLRIHAVKGTWGQPIIVAVVTLIPVEFNPNVGPVIVPANVGHLKRIEETIENWWQDGKHRRKLDIYLVVLAVEGWAPNLKPRYQPRLLTIHAEPCVDGWAVSTPQMAGMPNYISSFVRLLEPETVYMRTERIRKWVVKYINIWGSVTAFKAQEEIEKQSGKPLDSRDVMGVFSKLVEVGDYKLCEINGKPALRPATPSERSRRFLRRRGVEVVAFVIGIVASLIIWQIRPVIIFWLPINWLSWLLSTIFFVLLCEVFGKIIKKILKIYRPF